MSNVVDGLEGLIANLNLTDDVLLCDGRGDVAQAERIRHAVGLLNSLQHERDGAPRGSSTASCLEGMQLLRIVLSETPPPIDAILESGATPLIIYYLRPEVPGNTPELVFEASWAMLNIMSGDEQQVLKAIHSTDAVAAALALLTNQNLSCATREHAAWMLSNIAGTGHAYRMALVDKACVASLVQFVLDCVEASFNPSNGIWALGNLARPLSDGCVPNQRELVEHCATLIAAVRRVPPYLNQLSAIKELLYFLSVVVHHDTMDVVRSLGLLEPMCMLAVDVGRVEFLRAVDCGCLVANVDLICRIMAPDNASDDAIRMLLRCGGLQMLVSYLYDLLSQLRHPTGNVQRFAPLVGSIAWSLEIAVATDPPLAVNMLDSFKEAVGLLCDALQHFSEALSSGRVPSGFRQIVARLVERMWLLGVHLLCASSVHPEIGAALFVALSPAASSVLPEDVYRGKWSMDAVPIALIHATTLHAHNHPLLQPLMEALAHHTDEHLVASAEGPAPVGTAPMGLDA